MMGAGGRAEEEEEHKKKKEQIRRGSMTPVRIIQRRRGCQVEQEEDEEEELKRLCRESSDICLRIIIEHLHDFIDNPSWEKCVPSRSPRYEDWIEELHPENVNIVHDNAKNGQGKNTLTQKEVDRRFYDENSDHRIVWNDFMMKRNRMSLLVDPYPSSNLLLNLSVGQIYCGSSFWSL